MNYFVSLENQGNAEGGYNFGPRKMFLGIKGDFSQFFFISGGKYRIAMTCSLLERILCDIILLKAERPIT